MSGAKGEVGFVCREQLRGQTDFCEPQLNLLAHAQTIELDIGSRCGGHGICGGDRIRVASAAGAAETGQLSPLTEHELRHLTEAERVAGWRLACQVFPNDPQSSIRVEILPAEQIRPKEPLE